MGTKDTVRYGHYLSWVVLVLAEWEVPAGELLLGPWSIRAPAAAAVT
jgi:hypothetical protein